MFVWYCTLMLIVRRINNKQLYFISHSESDDLCECRDSADSLVNFSNYMEYALFLREDVKEICIK